MDYILQKTQRKVKLLKRKNETLISVKSIHNSKIKYFNDLQDIVLPKKEKELKLLQSKNEHTDVIEEQIKDIKDRSEEFDYYFKTSVILDEYFKLDDGIIYDDSRKSEVIREYYTALDMTIPREYTPDLRVNVNDCNLCEGVNCVKDLTQGRTCFNCGCVKDINIDTTPSYDQLRDTEMTTVVDYKRVTYFKEWLNQIQANERTSLPQEIIDVITLELKKERIKNMSKLSNSVVKRLLKKTGNSKHYEHIPYIINVITNVKPLNIPEPIEQKLIIMFEALQKPWEIYKPKDRKNFFSYPYTLHKLCQILDLKEYLKYFPLLKSREKLHKQDVIWKQVVEHIARNSNSNIKMNGVHWRFIPSL